ncbi:MAG: hypothetical protein R3B91_21900 [Planctomycetaceae bacterium]
MMDKPAQDGAAVDADRRQIATRDRAFAQQVAHTLVGDSRCFAEWHLGRRERL